jgi:hypothetical protein
VADDRLAVDAAAEGVSCDAIDGTGFALGFPALVGKCCAIGAGFVAPRLSGNVRSPCSVGWALGPYQWQFEPR